CRNIWAVSNADQATDIAFESAVQGGLGVFRICTDYLNEDDFEQDIRIKPVRNFAAVEFDPAAMEIDRRDGLFAFVHESMPREEFERLYPDADMDGFDSDDLISDWQDTGKVMRS